MKMKKFYFLTIILVSIVLGALIVLYFLSDISFEQILLFIAVLNGIAIIVFSIDKLHLSISVEEQNQEQKQTESPKVEVPAPMQQEIPEHSVDSINSDGQQWSKAMYNKYASRWNDVVESINYPIEDKSKAELSLLCWEIASQTIDYLLVCNDDQNALERNRSSVEAVLANKNINDLELKEYFNDPTTVPAKVIGVHDLLSSQLLKDQSFTTLIFGYQVELSPNDE